MKNVKNKTFEEAKSIRDCAIDNSFLVMRRRLDLMSEMMYLYAEKIKASQQISHGSLTPHFHVCAKGGCLGCLHVRWKKWFDPSKEQRKRQRMYGKKINEKAVASSFGSRDVSNVKQMLPRGDEYRELRELISTFEKVREQRERMVGHLSDSLRSTNFLDG